MKMRKLNRNQMKYLAITAMLIDHIAAVYVPVDTAAGQLMRFVGCLTGPVMAFFLAEGYRYTRDHRKYGLRLVSVCGAPAVLFLTQPLPQNLSHNGFRQGIPELHLTRHLVGGEFFTAPADHL